MNLVLHGIGDMVSEPAIRLADALIAEPAEKVDLVLANPPFGKKSSMTITNQEGEEDREALTYERQDFWQTTEHFTLKTRPLKLTDLRDFIECYNPDNRHERRETERFRCFSYDDLIARDKASLDLFWLKDDSLDHLDALPPPDVLQQEIIEHLEAALTAFRDLAAGLSVFMAEE